MDKVKSGKLSSQKGLKQPEGTLITGPKYGEEYASPSNHGKSGTGKRGGWTNG